MTHLIEDPAILLDLKRLLDRIMLRAALLDIHCLERPLHGPEHHGWTAQEIAEGLAVSSTVGLSPQHASRIVLLGLLDTGEASSPAFWGSAVGRAVAFWDTWEPHAIPRTGAAAALGCTRQNVLYMLRDGRLQEPESAGTNDLVSSASLSHAMRKRFPLRDHS